LPFSPDPSERYLEGARYPAECARRVAENTSGFTLLTPLLLARRGGNVYARDLHERDTALLAAYPTLPVYLLRPPSAAAGVPPRFHRLRRDSLAAAWAVPVSGAPGRD
jgi:hypothetical protein